MQQKLSISALCILVYLTGYAQAQTNRNMEIESERFFRLGGKVGVNINKLSGKSFKQGFKYNYQAGVFLQFNFSKRFGIQPEISWVQTSAVFTDDETEIFDDLFRGGTQKNASFGYLEIPLLLNINVGISKHVKIQAGPAFGYLLQQRTGETSGDIMLYNKNDFSAIGGFWLQLPVVHIGARYKYGFTNINNTGNGQQWKNQSIQIFIGITI